MPKKTSGAIIKAGRDELRMTQRELAAEVGVKASHIAYIENGQRKPSLALLKRLSDTLGVNPRELLFLTHPEAKYLTGAARRPEGPRPDAWRQFSTNRALLRRHSVTPGELKVLKQVALLEQVSNARNFLFILNSIRLAGSGDA
jgi:transcriptional regulator with XRE-family HTH domain